MAQAAQLCGVDKSTIVRRCQRGDFPQAQKKDDGTWVIPLANLVAAGLTDKIGQPTTTKPPSSTPPVHEIHTPTNTDALRQLHEENASLKAQLDMQQAPHNTITALQTVIRALEAPRAYVDTTTATEPAFVPTAEQPNPEFARRGSTAKVKRLFHS